MPIPLTCPCGFELEILDSQEGKKTRCPSCRRVLEVPYVSVAPVDEEIPEVIPVGRPTVARGPDGMPMPEANVRERERRARAEERRDPRRSRRRRGPRVVFGEDWFGNINGGIAGGGLTILIALIWLIAGLSMGYLFFYPLILLVAGFASIIYGLCNS
jgi:hypothetical protein